MVCKKPRQLGIVGGDVRDVYVEVAHRDRRAAGDEALDGVEQARQIEGVYGQAEHPHPPVAAHMG
ncbi:MAG: hypothetical protein IPI35_12505 [Deltaproteobacteria bacterium]|nr:hypothetical protein [Deltaproteobacteria bacterium]